MSDVAPTAEGPPRRRSSWSLKSIVEDVSGKPIGEFQDPERPVHPYLQAKGESRPGGVACPTAAGAGAAEPYDPVGHLYPPLVGARGREYHGPEHEHHTETLERHPTVPAGVGERPRSAGPAHRPERLYLHYLLLHLDRLGDAALAYLHQAVDEELAHRARPLPTPPPATPAREKAVEAVSGAPSADLPPPSVPAS